MKSADAGVAELEANVDSLIVILNDKLLDVLGDDITQDQAFAYANDVLKNAVGGISDIIHMPGLVNVDFEDVKTVMSEPGKAMMGRRSRRARTAPTRRPRRPSRARCSKGIDLSGARGVLVLIAANRSTFKLAESRNAMNCIRRYAAEDAHVIYGTAYDESLGDQLRVTVIATGLSPTRRAHAAAGAGRQQRAGAADRHRQPADPQPAGADAAADARLQRPDDAERLAQRPHRRGQGRRLASNGMDEIEIPAFLRKQAD
jgi:cell division protein FtsZ